MSKKSAIDITPFTRYVWRSNEIRNEWEEKIRRANKLHSEAEWYTVVKGYRDCCTVHMNKDNYARISQKMAEDGMFFQPLHKTGKYSGFSHKHIEPKNDNFDWYGVASTSKESLKEFQKADETNDHDTIGKLLDFPDCCRQSFGDRWSGGNIDPMFEATVDMADSKYSEKDNKKIVEIDEIPIETNQLLRYFGMRITSNLPCSFDCKKTIERGQYWKDTMKDIDLGGFNILKELLEMNLEWDALNGIVEVTTPIFKGITTTGLYDKRKIIKKGEVDW